MKTYKATVNGTVYEITLEVIDKEDVKVPVKAEAPKATDAPVSAGADTVKAPMPGNSPKVNGKAGDVVKKGQVLAILEAMKMENEIMAPADATVATVNVSAGQTVDTGAVIVTLA